jgi:universal stress protein E
VFHKILIAVDFSDPSRAAVRQAAALAKLCGADLTLAHVTRDVRSAIEVMTFGGSGGLVTANIDVMEADARTESDEQLGRIADECRAAGVTVGCRTLVGTSFFQLIRLVQGEGFDLVVAGSHGHAPLKRLWVGSTSGKLVRKCPAAVWIVSGARAAGGDEPALPRSILVACDFSPVSLKAAALGAALAVRADAELHLLHVYNTDDLRDVVPITGEVDEEMGRYRRLVRRLVVERLRQTMGELGGQPERFSLHAAPGTPWPTIRTVARRTNADLIVMGTIGRGGLAGMLIGNTAEKVLHAAETSVLSVKPDGFVSPVPDERAAASG